MKMKNLRTWNLRTQEHSNLGKYKMNKKKVMMSTFAITSQRRYFDEMMNEEPKDEER